MKKISKSQRTKMVMSIDDLYGRVNELFELYDEGDINEIKAHKEALITLVSKVAFTCRIAEPLCVSWMAERTSSAGIRLVFDTPHKALADIVVRLI